MNSINGVALDDELVWSDEWAWTPMLQSVDYAVTGDLIAQHGLKVGGRPVTLTGRIRYAGLAAVYQLLSDPTPMTLSLFGREFQVIFRHADGPIQAIPDYEVANPAEFPELGYSLTLRLTEV